MFSDFPISHEEDWLQEDITECEDVPKNAYLENVMRLVDLGLGRPGFLEAPAHHPGEDGGPQGQYGLVAPDPLSALGDEVKVRLDRLLHEVTLEAPRNLGPT